MNVSRRALMVRAGAVAWGLALPLRRSFAETKIKEYRLTAKPAVVNRPATATRIPLSGLMTAPCPARNTGFAKALRSGWW